MLYVPAPPEQVVVLPLMAPGCDGIFSTVTANTLAVDAPQVLFAVTEMFPLVPAVAVIEALVDVPVQPLGSVHV